MVVRTRSHQYFGRLADPAKARGFGAARKDSNRSQSGDERRGGIRDRGALSDRRRSGAGRLCLKLQLKPEYESLHSAKRSAKRSRKRCGGIRAFALSVKT